MVIKFISDINLIESGIISASPQKWGDQEEFLRKFIPQLDLVAIAEENNSIVAFSLAKTIIAKNYIAIAFFATRVLADYRNKGIAKKLLEKLSSRLIIKEKFLKLWNIFKPVYFVSITANPIVFAVMSKTLQITTEVEIAEKFAQIFSPQNKFNRETFVLERAFLGSAEYYSDTQKIPWSNDESSNLFLEERLNLKNKTGNGLVFTGRIF